MIPIRRGSAPGVPYAQTYAASLHFHSSEIVAPLGARSLQRSSALSLQVAFTTMTSTASATTAATASNDERTNPVNAG